MPCFQDSRSDIEDMFAQPLLVLMVEPDLLLSERRHLSDLQKLQ